jgi:hypothetical protein
MKICILLASALSLLLRFNSFAADPVQTFVAELRQTRDDEVWFVPDDDKLTKPKGAYLYRFELDLNGDGQTEVFVATSLDADRKGERWNIFKKDAGGEYQKIKDSFFIGSDLRMKVENGIRKYSFYVPQKQMEGGSYLGYFWLDATGAWHDETQGLTDAAQGTMDGNDADTLGTDGKPDALKIAQKLNLGTPVTIAMKKVLLAKYSQNSATPWRDVKKDFTLSQQYKDPADAADIASVANWQPPASP